MSNYDNQIESLALNPFAFSPVLIIGNVGCGKTYFLEKYRAKRNIVYKPAFGEWSDNEGAKIFNAEEICKNIIEAIYKSKENSWKEMFDPVDVIIIDDIQRLAGKTTIQQLLFSYFLTCNKAIIITSNSELNKKDFSEELISFLSTGAHIYIDDPDKESKLEFLVTSLCAANMEVENEALLWLSNQNFISYAAIKGFVKTLNLFSTNGTLSIADCIKCSKGYIY